MSLTGCVKSQGKGEGVGERWVELLNVKENGSGGRGLQLRSRAGKNVPSRTRQSSGTRHHTTSQGVSVKTCVSEVYVLKQDRN